MTISRLLLDISTLLRHWERADGITRTLSNFAAYALDHVSEIEFVYLGGDAPLQVKKEYVRLLLAGQVRIDTSHFRDPGAKRRVRDRLPNSLKTVLLWLQRPRRQGLVLLDRIAIQRPRYARLAAPLRSRLLDNKYRRALTAPDGSAMQLVPHDIAFTTMDSPTHDDILILAGSDWVLMSNSVRQLSPKPRIAAFCQDIIPLLFPQFFSAMNVLAFRGCLEAVYARADLLFFSGRQIAADTGAYFRSQGIPEPSVEIVALGADVMTPSRIVRSLPAPLVAGEFALFVSTIEPRKNHRLLFDVWKQLLDEGIPQSSGFKLVFVGRKGWLVDDLWREMTAHPSYGTSLIILSDVDDETLASIYNQCAFTLYPSLYEGFGLPIIESFRYGKATIASTAGALPETVAGFSPCLDPADVTAWREMLKRWIGNPSVYRALENEIKARYSARSWSSAASDFFQIIRERLLDPSRTADHDCKALS